MNLYEYVNGKAVIATDPVGEIFWITGCAKRRKTPPPLSWPLKFPDIFDKKCIGHCKDSGGTPAEIAACVLICEGANKLAKKLGINKCDALWSWCQKLKKPAIEACYIMHNEICGKKL